jgi:hypothetical protein
MVNDSGQRKQQMCQQPQRRRTVGLPVIGPRIAPKERVGRSFQGRLDASLKGSRYTNELADPELVGSRIA